MAKTGMIIVSHSEEIANGVVKLASEMSGDNVVFKAAGGTGDGRLGTSAMTVLKAKCHIVDAPLVEGAFFGAVEAAASDDVQKIISESDHARNLHKN